MIRLANAPCSWGTLEFEGVGGARIEYAQMLDELKDTGYVGTELGDWGFMPSDPDVLRSELQQRALAMVGAFVQGPFRDRDAWADVAERAVRTVHDATGLRTAFHAHCAGFVETPDEMARLLDLTDPNVVGLVLDTGHYTYGSGANDPAAALAGLERFGERVLHVHFKDCHPDVADRARAECWDYFRALREGVFCELGQGCVDFPSVVAWLHAHDYAGWIVVEQDVLPGLGAPKESARRNREYLASLGLDGPGVVLERRAGRISHTSRIL